MEWSEYTPTTRYLGDWNEEIYCRGGNSQYQQQQLFDANELGGLPSLPENESQSDITILNNTSHNTPAFACLKICNRQPQSYKDSNIYNACLQQQQTIPDCSTVMMPLVNSDSTDSIAVKDEQVDNAIIGDILQQCVDKNDNSQVLSLKTETSQESAINPDKGQPSDVSYKANGQDEMQQSKMPAAMASNFNGIHYSAGGHCAGVSHIDNGYLNKVPAILPSFSTTPFLPTNPLSHSINPFKLHPMQSQSNEQRLAEGGPDPTGASNNHDGVVPENQSNTSQACLPTNNPARLIPPKNCAQNAYNAVQNTGWLFFHYQKNICHP